ncbi:MAG: DUF378 domain-containing protein [Candidatus Aenigmarchaeota archaeon]|nr:DUF378 domain-containing protein [Candidatus Aenigmarchaeota archaeon]
MAKNDTIGLVANILLIVGGLNILLSEFGYNVIGMIFGSIPMLMTIINVLIGLSALYAIYTNFLK